MLVKDLLRKLLGDRTYHGLSRRKVVAKAYCSYLAAKYLRREAHLGYTREYYAASDGLYGHSFSAMAESLVRQYRPGRVIDVGCGSGAFGAALMRAGVAEVHAFDYSPDAVALAREKGVTSATVFDVTAGKPLGATADLCTSFEVAEHLPGRYARRLCEVLSAAAPVVVMTAAPPGQGGHLHLNEQPPEYWIDLMRQQGMAYDADARRDLQASWKDRVAAHYHDNVLTFRRT